VSINVNNMILSHFVWRLDITSGHYKHDWCIVSILYK